MGAQDACHSPWRRSTAPTWMRCQSPMMRGQSANIHCNSTITFPNIVYAFSFRRCLESYNILSVCKIFWACTQGGATHAEECSGCGHHISRLPLRLGGTMYADDLPCEPSRVNWQMISALNLCYDCRYPLQNGN